MNYNLSLQEFQKFEQSLARMSYSPTAESVNTVVDKCQNLLDNLYKFTSHSFSIQLVNVKFHKGNPYDKLTALRYLVGNIVEDLKVRLKAHLENVQKDSIETQMMDNNLLLSEQVTSLRQDLDLLSRNLRFRESEIAELNEKIDDQQIENAKLIKFKSLFLASLFAFATVVNLIAASYQSVLFFDWRLFSFVELFLVSLLILNFNNKQYSKGYFILLFFVLLSGLVYILLQQSDWKVQVTTAGWSLVITLIAAVIVYLFRWNK